MTPKFQQMLSYSVRNIIVLQSNITCPNYTIIDLQRLGNNKDCVIKPIAIPQRQNPFSLDKNLLKHDKDECFFFFPRQRRINLTLRLTLIKSM